MVSMTRRTLLLSIALLLAALGLLASLRLFDHVALASPAFTFDVADCDVVVNPGESIQAAINSAANDQTICVRGGVYNEALTIRADKTNLTLIAWPGETPVLDGLRRLPSNWISNRFGSLVTILGNGTVLDGFEVTQSTADGVDVGRPGQGVIIRNTIIHDNWGPGLIVSGDGTNLIRNVLIENNRVYNNLLRARFAPVIYRGERSGSGPSDWTFTPETLWDTPFWSGVDTDLPETYLNDLAMTFNDDGRTTRVYAGSGRANANRVGFIGANYSASGQEFTYYGADLLFHDPASNKWTLFFKGSSLGLPTGTVIDAFQIDGAAAPVECPACAPIVMSFDTTATISISGTATTISSGDLVRFQPTAIGALGEVTAGNFTLFRRAADMSLPAAANIDALDRAPDGRYLASFTAAVDLPGVSLKKEDLAAYDELTGAWSLFFDGSLIPYNPFPDDLTAAWLDRQGHIYVSADPTGGSGLVFISAEDSVARGNVVYNNYGEGLVAGRYTTRITFEDNVAYDNEHANLYLNSTAYPLVQRNLVFCTDNREFWRKGSVRDYRPGPGLQIRDEDFEGQTITPPPSIGQVIINNLVIGCSTNFGVATQRAAGTGGLKDALIANNTFANARGDTATGVNNVEFTVAATYDNSRFINNLIVQNPAGAVVAATGTQRPDSVAFATLTMANNLYSAAPGNRWPGGETGRIVAAPQFASGTPPLPAAGAIPDANAYRLSYTSPAFDAGLTLTEVSVDYFGGARSASGQADIGAHELPHIGAITVVLETSSGRFTQAFDFTTSYAPNAFRLSGGERTTTGPLQAGVYTVAVTSVDGWTAAGTCDDGSPPDAIALGPTETVTCTFTAERLTRLTVSNALEPADDPQLFDFSLSPGESFQLGNASRTFVVAEGNYALSAAVPDGWQQTSATCDNGNAPGALTLAAGDWVTCSFSHRKLGRIVVQKQTLPAGAAQTFAFTASYDGDGFTLGDGQQDISAYLGPDVYAVAETLPTGWTQVSATCDDGSAPDAISLSAAETVTCAFVNARLALDASLTPTPDSVTAPGGDVSFAVVVTNSGAVALQLTGLTDSVYGNVASAANGAIKATTCALPQTLGPGAAYNCAFTAAVSGAGGSTQTNTLTASANGPANSTVSVSAGASVAINTPPPGRIIVIKQTSPAGAAASFTFTADYNATGFSLSHGQSNDSGPLPSGATYSVTESVPTGWAQASATCDDGSPPGAISLSATETVTCTFVNARLGLSASLTPTPTNVTAPGGDVSFAVAVTNSGAASVQLTSLTDSIYGNIASAANGAIKSTTCGLPQNLNAGGSYSCAFTATVSGAGGTSQTNTLMAAATAAGGSTVSGSAGATVAIDSPPAGRIIVTKLTNPANTPGTFAFTASYIPGGFSLSHGQSRDSGPLPSGATYSVSETVPAGWALETAVCVGDDDSTDPARIVLDPNETVTCTFTNRRTSSGPDATIYVATATTGTVRGVTYAPGDILAYDGRSDSWSLYFDGSDVGWTRAVSDFTQLPDGSLLLVAGARTTLGAGATRFTLEVQDIARFVPTSLGQTTAGTFSLYFDGSDVTLSTAGERIDALAIKNDGTLLISTSDRATVKSGGTSITGQDEDLLAFKPTQLGATTAGAWSLLPDGFDGSTLTGMAAEDVTGAWYNAATGDYYLTITNAFKVAGVKGNQRTVLKVTPAGAVSVYWDAATAGFTGTVDALWIVP